MRHTQNGSVLVYILIAVGLFAAISYAVSRDGSSGQSTTQLSESEAQLRATEIIALATQAKMAVDQMSQWGIEYQNIRFDNADEAGYTSNTSQQIMHPAGGGLSLPANTSRYFKSSYESEEAYGWTWKNTTNVEWSATPAHEVIFSAGNLRPEVCAAINKLLTGSNDMPPLAHNFRFKEHFSHESTPHLDFLISECPECEGRDAICMRRDELDWHQFYSIAGSR